MAYMSKELASKLAPEIKDVFKKYGLKGSVQAAENGVTLIVTVKSGKIDYCENYNNEYANQNNPTWVKINRYGYTKHFTGIALESLTELLDAINKGNYDNSDSNRIDVGWYVDLNIGSAKKHYVKHNAYNRKVYSK